MRRTILVTLLQVFATVLLLPATAASMAAPFTVTLSARYPLVIWVIFGLFALGVFLHWLTARMTMVYSGWAYWVIFFLSLFGLWGPGGLAGWRNLRPPNVSTFRQMRNGTALPPERVPCPKCHQVRGNKRLWKITMRQVLWGGWTCPTCGCDVAQNGHERII